MKSHLAIVSAFLLATTALAFPQAEELNPETDPDEVFTVEDLRTTDEKVAGLYILKKDFGPGIEPDYDALKSIKVTPEDLIPWPQDVALDALQAGRIYTMCEGETPPESCTCTGNIEEEIIRPPFENTRKLFACNPTECLCGNGETKEVLFYMEVQVRKWVYNEVSKIEKHLEGKCGDGRDPERCDCLRGENRTLNFGNYLNEAREAYFCVFDKCHCSDGSTVDVDPRALYQNTVNTACGEQGVQSCDCENEGQLRMPVNNVDDLITCAPTQCTCKDETTVAGNLVQVPEELKGTQVTALGNTPVQDVMLTMLLKMCDWGQVSHCTCGKRGDGTISAPFTPSAFFECDPKVCQCQANNENFTVENIEVKEVELPEPFDKISKIHDACADDDAPEVCRCTRGDKTFLKPDIFEGISPVSVLWNCLPDVCLCPFDEKEIRLLDVELCPS